MGWDGVGVLPTILQSLCIYISCNYVYHTVYIYVCVYVYLKINSIG